MIQFLKDHNSGYYGYIRLHHHLDKLTSHYMGLMKIARTPIFHPYNPTASSIENVRSHNGYPGTVVTIRCPESALSFLPEPILRALKENNVSPDKTDIFFVTQNMPWKNEQLEFKPHYWVHGQAEYEPAIQNATFSLDTPCRVGIFSPTNGNINCDGTKDVLSTNPISVSSHPGKDESGQHEMIICSPPNVGVFGGINFEQTDSFYSMALTSDRRAAVTLHWLLNDEDQQNLTNISHAVSNMSEFLEQVSKLENSRLNMEGGPLTQLVNLIPNETYEPHQQKPLLFFNKIDSNTIKAFLFSAIRENDLEKFCQWIYHKGININAKNDSQQSLLHMASVCNDETFMSMLLAEGADPNIVDGANQTPLQYAAYEGRLNIIEQYLFFQTHGTGTKLTDDNLKNAFVYSDMGKQRRFNPQGQYDEVEAALTRYNPDFRPKPNC